MEITYIGTAASEGLPSLFCECPVCTEARKSLGKAFRGRAGICIDKRLLIDFPPDIYYGAARAAVDLSLVDDIVITHAHEDHFTPYELSTRREPVYCRRERKTELRVWGTMRAGRILNTYVPGAETGHALNRGLRFDYSPPFEPIITAGGLTVYPIPADHDKNQECRMMLIENPETGARLLYAHDTGLFPAETLDFLKGKHCDIISLDCTNVMLGTENDSSHMGLKADIVMKKRLLDAGTADENTRFIIHHFSHNGFITDEKVWGQDEFEAKASEYGFIMAYDGMKITC